MVSICFMIGKVSVITMSNQSFPNISAVCDNVDFSKYDALLSTVCGVLCIFGLVYTFFGYRCFKAVMFLSGLIFGGTTVFLLCRDERIFQLSLSTEVAAGVAAGIGVLCGFITMLVRYVGLFLQGFFLGLLFAFAGIMAMQSVYNPGTPWIPVSILFGTGVIFSLLTLKFQKKFLIIGTAVFGSVLITLCIDYFIEEFFLFLYAWEALMAASAGPVCWYTWVVLSVWPFLSLCGILLQWLVTSKGYDHTDVIIAQRRRKQVRTHLVREHRDVRFSSIDHRPPTRRNTSIISSGSSEEQRPPPRRPSGARRSGVRDARRDAASSVAPPTYFECVELGVGDTLQGDDQIVRTDAGIYVRRRSSASHRDGMRNLLVEQLLSSGENREVTRRSGQGAHIPPDRLHSRRPGDPRRSSDQGCQPMDRFAAAYQRRHGAQPQMRAPPPNNPRKRTKRGRGARRYKKVSPVPTPGLLSHSPGSDTQMLLSDASGPRRHGDVVANERMARGARRNHRQVGEVGPSNARPGAIV